MARGYPARPCFADCAAFSKLPLQQLRALCAFAHAAPSAQEAIPLSPIRAAPAHVAGPSWILPTLRCYGSGLLPLFSALRMSQ